MGHPFRIIIFLCVLTLPIRATGFSPINVQEAVEIGGMKQWISLKGDNDRLPVLLFLHGGPGNSAMGYADKFTLELQKYFVVVQWDQRGSGKTARINSTDTALTVSLMMKDALEIIRYLCSRFARTKIYLMGHSWGGFLGLQVAATHPELLEAYFAISPMVNQLESDRLSLLLMNDSDHGPSDSNALEELSLVRIPFQNGDQLYYHRKWIAKKMLTAGPEKTYVRKWATRWLGLYNEASAFNFLVLAPEIKCPIFFFIGVRDYLTYFKITEEYYNKLKAEKKDLFWFTNSAHNLNLTEPKKLQEIIISLRSSN